jgi:hypothetical protein
MEPTPAYDVDVLGVFAPSTAAAWASDTADSADVSGASFTLEAPAAPEYVTDYDSSRDELSVCVALLAWLVGTVGLRYVKKKHPYRA